MTFEEKKDFVKSKGKRIPHNISEKKIDSIIKELEQPKQETKLTTVRMIYSSVKGKSIIDIDESKVEAHLRAGWTYDNK